MTGYSDMPTSQELAEDRTDLAEERTNWAEDRTILANERTYAGWMRTGLASAGIGLGFQAIFREIDPTWLAKAGATVFLTLAIVVFWAAQDKACSLMKRLDAHTAEPMGRANYRRISIMFVVSTITLGALLWLL
jgi:putative membrane protein